MLARQDLVVVSGLHRQWPCDGEEPNTVRDDFGGLQVLQGPKNGNHQWISPP